MIKRNNLVYNISSINEYGVDKNIKQPIRVAVKDVRLITDYKLNIIYDNGATKNIELINNSIKKFEYVSEGNKIIIETNNNDKFEIEIPIDGGKWELVEGLLRTKDGAKITLHDISEIDSDLGAEDKFLNKKGEFVRPSYFYYGPTAPQESKKYDIWISSITLNQYQFIEGVWIAFVPIKGLYGIIDGNSKDTIYLDGNDNKNILIDGNKDNFVIIQDIIY